MTDLTLDLIRSKWGSNEQIPIWVFHHQSGIRLGVLIDPVYGQPLIIAEKTTPPDWVSNCIRDVGWYTDFGLVETQSIHFGYPIPELYSGNLNWIHSQSISWDDWDE